MEEKLGMGIRGKVPGSFSLRIALSLAPRSAAPSSCATALGQHRPQVSGGDYETSEVFVDALPLLLELVEHLIEPPPLVLHAPSFSRGVPASAHREGLPALGFRDSNAKKSRSGEAPAFAYDRFCTDG